MSLLWEKSLRDYRHPVDLSSFEDASKFPRWFWFDLSIGNRAQTTAFEEHFQKHGRRYLEPWIQVVFWKLYSQTQHRHRTPRQVHSHWKAKKISASTLWEACQRYVETPTEDNFESFQELFGFSSPHPIGVAAAFPAFMKPDSCPLVDTRIAEWADSCRGEHNAADPEGPQLVRPVYLDERQQADLCMNDFDFFEVWTRWCQHTAQKLRELTPRLWRARDVEMAVCHAWGDRSGPQPKIQLPPLAPSAACVGKEE